MGQECHNDHKLVESNAGGFMALRSSFWLPVAFAALFLAFDMYHTYTQMDCNGKELTEIVSLYGFALLRAINSYFPSTLLPFSMLVVLQQGIYHVSAGVVQWKLGNLLFQAAAFLALYAVYIANDGADVLLVTIMAVATIVFGFSIWLSLDKEVHSAPAAWRRAMGKA